MLAGQDGATGRGAYYCTKGLEKLEDWQPADIRILIKLVSIKLDSLDQEPMQ